MRPIRRPQYIYPGATIGGIPPNAFYTQEFNLTLEQQLATQLGLRVAYVASISRKYYIARDEFGRLLTNLPECVLQHNNREHQ